MKEISILIGGKAGDGIKQTGNFIGRLLNRMGWRVFIYEDYPSLITGGHNFSVIRAGEEKVYSHRDKVDVVIALNKDAIEKHKNSFKKETIVIYDSDLIKEGEKDWIGIPMTSIAKENNLPLIVRNTISLGAFAASVGIDFELVEEIIRKVLRKKTEDNIKVSRKGYDFAKKVGRIRIKKLEKKEPLPLLTGNEALSLGAVKGGMKLYVAYPMTPASSILHFLAKNQDKLKVLTVQPENEISVILMAEGAAASGVRTMVGTSGGGFALMTEALSLAGQAEIPIVIILSQRAGPATGVPTYTMQGDLLFALNAGHGEFLRVVVAPGDPEEAFYWGAEALNFAWKFQIPVIVMLDKHLSESTYSSEVDPESIKGECPAKLWDKKGEYKRYQITPDGVSPIAFYGQRGAIVKYNSYEHDEFGITTEDAQKVKRMIEKRLSKKPHIIEEMKKEEAIKIYGNKNSKKILITWGSTKGVAKEVGEELGLKVIQVISMEPFPVWALKKELDGAETIIDIEVNATAPLAKLLECNGLFACEKILKYDARPFTLDELKEKVLEKIK